MDVRKKKVAIWHDGLEYGMDFGPILADPDLGTSPRLILPRTNPGYAPADPLFFQQWHLFDAEGVDMDINVTRAWLDYTGAGVRVGVYDDAVQHAGLGHSGHSDLNDTPGCISLSAVGRSFRSRRAR